MKLNYRMPDPEQIFRFALLLMSVSIGILILLIVIGCASKPPEMKRYDQMAQRAQIYSEYKQKFGGEFKDWTPSQQDQLRKEYEKVK